MVTSVTVAMMVVMAVTVATMSPVAMTGARRTFSRTRWLRLGQASRKAS
ncbi:hypothetical protein [Fulvitalea axinellae]